MPNPALLLCDTDALIQVFMVGETRLLRLLRDRFAVQPCVVPDVDGELAWNATYRDRFDDDRRKALEAGLLVPFDAEAVGRVLPGPTAAIQVMLGRAKLVGESLNDIVDVGEAYTHAAASLLSMPAMSNDYAALKALREAKRPGASPTVRSWDLLVFGFHDGLLTTRDLDSARKQLREAGEWLPRVFRSQGCASALAQFDSRLLVLGKPAVGRQSPAPRPHEVVLNLAPV